MAEHHLKALVDRLEAPLHESEALVHQLALRLELLLHPDHPFQELDTNPGRLAPGNQVLDHASKARLDVILYAPDVFIAQRHWLSHRHLQLYSITRKRQCCFAHGNLAGRLAG